MDCTQAGLTQGSIAPHTCTNIFFFFFFAALFLAAAVFGKVYKCTLPAQHQTDKVSNTLLKIVEHMAAGEPDICRAKQT